MVRNLFGSLLAAIGATAAVWSPFRAWYDGRLGRDIRVEDVFTGITSVSADVVTSLVLPMAAAALLTLIGILFRSRVVVALAGLVVLGFTVLWMVRQGQASGSLTVGGGNGAGIGVALAAGGGLLILLGALVMRGRRPRGRLREDGYDHPRYDDGYGHPPYEDAYGRPQYDDGYGHPPYEDQYPPHAPEPHPYDQRPPSPQVHWQPPPAQGQPPPPPGPGGHPPPRPQPPQPGGHQPPRQPPWDDTPPYGMPPVDPDADETRTMPPVGPPPPPPQGRPGPHDPDGRPPR